MAEFKIPSRTKRLLDEVVRKLTPEDKQFFKEAAQELADNLNKNVKGQKGLEKKRKKNAKKAV